MKRAFALVMAFVLCLGLYACGEEADSSKKETTQSTIGEQNATTDNSTEDGSNTGSLYDHTLKHTLLNDLYGDWYLEGNLSWMVMPTHITFKEDGTCFAEFPEHAIEKTKTFYWGIVPDCTDFASTLYVRIGVADDIWYLFQVYFNAKREMRAMVAQHSNDPIEMVTIEGLSQDGISGMWFDMLKGEPVRHPPVENICGEWKTNADAAPFQSLLINEDGTCVVDGVDARWQTEDTFTSKTSLSIFVLIDGEVRFGIVYFKNTGVATLTEPIGEAASFLPYEAFKE